MPNPCNSPDVVHLHTHSEFSFLDGASHVEPLVRSAAEHGQAALALTDHDNLCGAPEFLHTCRTYGLKPIFGSELTLDTGHVTVLAKNRTGYSSLCRLLTRAHLDNERGKPMLRGWLAEQPDDSSILHPFEGLILLSGCRKSPLASFLLRRRFPEARAWAIAGKSQFGADFFIEIQRTLEPQQRQLNYHLIRLARDLDIPLVATNNVHYVQPEQFRAQDLLTCIRHLIPVDEPHEDRQINNQLFLKSSSEMAELFRDLPDALLNTLAIADRCETYEISEPRFQPRFHADCDPAAELHRRTFAGAAARYGELSLPLRARIEYELRVIGDLGFSDYFLVVHDLVQFARRRSFRHAGRGSAADSVVAYCLDITKVDSFARNLRFERFINPERRDNLPDIDIDFDSRYRDDVTAYVTEKYGADHVATVCTFARFRARSAIRDVAKALGFAVEDIDHIAKSTHWATRAHSLRRAIERRPELRALKIPEERFGLLLDLCAEIDDLPRYISTHLGGVVITGDPIWEVSPLQMAAKGVQVIQYDKDGVEDLRLLKLDLLCLRMLGAVEDSVVMISSTDKHFDLERIPLADEPTFERIRSAETAGAFQIESPAQMSLHPRLKTRTYEDIVASVALIRPGPVQGEMVEPFIRRRNTEEPFSGIHPVMDRILGHTYGVVLYQEQVVSIAVELAGFTPGQADSLRRTISHHRSHEKMQELGEAFIAQAVQNGIAHAVAEKVFSWLQSYAGFGFCEAHAAAFGDTSYRTAYLLEHHPAEFYAAILNNEPMGFYPPATIVNEARRRGVRVLNPDVSCSASECTIEDGAIRIGLKLVKNITEAATNALLAARPYHSWGDFLRRSAVPRDVLENLILCGACDGFSPHRRALLFTLGDVQTRAQNELPFEDYDIPLPLHLPDFSPYEKLCREWDILGFSPSDHPLTHWRADLARRRVLTTAEVKQETDNQRILRAAGWVIRPHTPPTKSGKTVVFFSLEDETGLLNITVFPSTYERFGHLIFSHPLLMIEGRKDRRGANSLVADSIFKLKH
jgi:error-prone DNA polymerase